ncbi:MAG: helix-turn-helix transcriptional regulator, partial [Clostridia bacterium]|nr:helix-turn-helix transcriptional regulator [Clostridia bacterium]
RFTDIKPFVRYARILEITQNTLFEEVVPLDARLFYVKDGLCKIQIEDVCFEIEKGGIIYINSGIHYTILPSAVTFLAVNFDFTYSACYISAPVPPIPLKNNNNYELIEHISFLDFEELNTFLVLKNCLSLESKFAVLVDEYNKKSPYYTMKNTSQLTEIIIDVLRRKVNSNPDNIRFNAEKIAAYIQNHLSEKINNKVLGEIFHFHPNYISSEFCRYFGKPIHKYLLEQRILKAVSLLETDDGDMNEIAVKVGFSDANYFSRYFKKIIGVPPGRYKKDKC